MADEIARLGVVVDSTPAVSAAKDLDSLAAAGDRADAATTKLKDSWQSATFSPAQLYSANKALNAFKAEAAAAAIAASRVDDSWKKVTFDSGHLMRANASLRKFRDESRQAAAAAQQLAQANQLQATSHHQVAKAAVGYTKSAKELAFATRNLPAQFTDIAISLQAGQNPLTVLLQQGGQLKDMFGGVGLAARAMGNYIKGLINVWTVGAAAVAVFFTALIKGDAESRNLNKTLILQGESLGITTNGLIRASEELTRFGQSQGKAAAALNATAASGKIFGDSIQRVAQAAMTLEREGGQAIEDTVADFASLADKPVDAAVELDKKYHFLTASVYNQIKALEEQGDIMGAVEVSQNALADTIDQRGAEIEKNLGYVEQRWRELAGAAKFAWDAMLDIGRQDSVEERMADLNERLVAARNTIENPPGGRFGAEALAQARRELVSVKAGFDAITEEIVAADKESRRKRDQRIAAEATASLDRMAGTYRENAEKRKTLITQVNAEADRGIAAARRLQSATMVADIAAIEEDRAKAIAGIEKRYADPEPKKGRKSQSVKDAEKLLRDRAREYESLDQALDRHEDTLNAAGEAQEKLSSFEKFAIKTLSDLENGHTNLDEAQQAEMRTRIEALRVIDQQNQAREKEAKLLQISADLHQHIADKLARQGEQHTGEMVGIGRGRNEAALAQTLEQIRNDTLRDRIILEEQYQKQNAVGSAQHLADLAAINEAERQLVANEIQHLKDRKEAMMDWRNGARSAMEDIAWEMGDVAGRTRDAFTNAFGAMNSALTSFANTGKLKIRDFATVVIAELLRIALTIAVSKALSNMFGGGASAPAMTNNIGGSILGQSNVYAGGITAARGAVVAGGRSLSAFARGGLLGAVRSSPTLLPLATGGTALLAEQEPEGIFPLARGPNGKLGIRASGGGSVTNVSTVVNIAQDGTSSSETSVQSENSVLEGKKLGDLLTAKIRTVLAEERRQGGTLWAMQHGR